MKRCTLLSIVVLIMVLLSACDFFAPTLTGTIEEIDEDTAIVKIEQGPILETDDQAQIDLSAEDPETFQVGDEIRVKYGLVEDTTPVTLETLNIEMVE